MGTEFMLKMEANGSIEEVADAKVNFTEWIQLYPFTDQDFTKTLADKKLKEMVIKP